MNPLAGIAPPIGVTLLRHAKIERSDLYDPGPVAIVAPKAIENVGQPSVRFRTEYCIREPANLVRRRHIVRRQPVACGVPVKILAVLDAVGTRENAEPRIHLLDGGIVPPRHRGIRQAGFLKREKGVGENDVLDELVLVPDDLETESGPLLVVEVRRETNRCPIDVESFPPRPPVETAAADLVERMDPEPDKLGCHP